MHITHLKIYCMKFQICFSFIKENVVQISREFPKINFGWASPMIECFFFKFCEVINLNYLYELLSTNFFALFFRT